MGKILTKKKLISVAKAINNDERIDADIVNPFLDFKFQESSRFSQMMIKSAAALSFFFASVLVIFPEVRDYLIEVLPSNFELSDRIAKALDFVWGLVGKPVKKTHLMYHMPNIIIYAFGVAGVRQLWKKLNKNNWKDQVKDAQDKLGKMALEGIGRYNFAQGFSLLFVGDGDQIARGLVIDDPMLGATIADRRLHYTNLWGKYTSSEGEEEIYRVLELYNSKDAGEYVLFPVMDEHLFLPGPYDFDTAPHRVDIAVQRIRAYENEKGLENKRLIIVGDREQKSNFVTASKSGRIISQDDEISLRTIAEKYDNITVVDPTDTTLMKIISIADGRQILFRSSDHGVEKYSGEFYRRLSLLGYQPTKEENLTVGYDISDLETEHQVVSQKQSVYLPIILSRDIFDGLVKSHLREDSYIFVPHLIKAELQKLVAEQ
ncbi:MAG: hypothetical protein GY742_09070 [Hyphomicrobiales bacterium]|nr:hypothetical protein [Hyphomicrobiales bacterium]